MVSMRDLRLTAGRLVRVYDTGRQDAADAITVLWHHGSPQTGPPPMTGANLSGVDAAGAALTGDLTEADLTKANVTIRVGATG
jgi:uncharacterized protein YjbI with pentapeptide repeats